MAFDSKVLSSGWVLTAAIVALVLAIIFFVVAYIANQAKDASSNARMYLFLILGGIAIIAAIILAILYFQAREAERTA